MTTAAQYAIGFTHVRSNMFGRLESMSGSAESLAGEQFKTVVEERVDENGKRIRVTRKIRLRLVHEQVCPAVAERRVLELVSNDDIF
jgi:hypothetical protein